MGNDPVVIIRKYEAKDRQRVREICCQTALMGEPSTVFFEDDEILSDALTLYFTDYEPESCFIAESGGEVIGYLLGAKDTQRIEKVFTGKIALPLFFKALSRCVFFKRKNARLIFHILVSLAKGEFKAPHFHADYPGTLHINLFKGYRAAGAGSRLIEAYLNYLKAERVKGVHFATMSDHAGRFFEKQGFKLLFSGKRSYFRYFLGKSVPLYIYGMRLNEAGSLARV